MESPYTTYSVDFNISIHLGINQLYPQYMSSPSYLYLNEYYEYTLHYIYLSSHIITPAQPHNIGNIPPCYYINQVNLGGYQPLPTNLTSIPSSPNQSNHTNLPYFDQENIQPITLCRTHNQLIPYMQQLDDKIII